MSASRPSKIVPRFHGDAAPTAAKRQRNGTAAGKRHMGRVAELPCVLCGLLGQLQTSKTDVHHVREEAGAAQRNSDFLTIPLCHECHQGASGIHGDKSLLRLVKRTELDLLAETIEALLESKD